MPISKMKPARIVHVSNSADDHFAVVVCVFEITARTLYGLLLRGTLLAGVDIENAGSILFDGSSMD